MASSNTANWSVYSRNGEANVEGLLSWFEGPKYLPFALSATRLHLTPTSYQQTRQLFISHKLAHQSQIRELPSGRPQSKNWEKKGGLWLTALPFTPSASSILSSSVYSRKLPSASQIKLHEILSQEEQETTEDQGAASFPKKFRRNDLLIIASHILDWIQKKTTN